MKTFTNTSFFTVLLAATVFFAGCSGRSQLRSPAGSMQPVEQLAHQIDRALADSAMSQSDAAVKVVSLETGETLYSHNSQMLMHPASNMKLLSTASALKNLGPNFRFKTEVYTDSAAHSDSAITGNLYIKGYGNPDLTTDDLRWMVNELKKKGVRSVSGNLVCDESYLDDLYWGNGWMWDDVSAWEWAPICALTVNDNCVEITVAPGDTIGAPLSVSIEPETRFMQIANTAKTVAESDSQIRKAYKAERVWRPIAKNIYEVAGGRYLTDRTRTYTVDVVDASYYVGTLFSELMREAGIMFYGKIERGLLPENPQLLIRHQSEPLTEVVLNTNKVSDNLSAELLLKVVGAEVSGTPGTAEKGLSAIRKMLQEAGVDSTSYRITDGSGVSRYNIITANLLIELLKSMDADPRVSAEYRASLPIAGIDGTLRSRMHDTAAQSVLRAKTGTLSGVTTLSGYTVTADGEKLAFSMMMQHFVLPASKIRAVQDNIGEILNTFSRRPVAE